MHCQWQWFRLLVKREPGPILPRLYTRTRYIRDFILPLLLRKREEAKNVCEGVERNKIKRNTDRKSRKRKRIRDSGIKSARIKNASLETSYSRFLPVLGINRCIVQRTILEVFFPFFLS